MNANANDTKKTAWVDPDDAPELDEKFFERADQYEGERLVRRGRPPGSTKESTTIRLDADVLAALKASGPGWQTRVNEVLRAAMALHKLP